MKINLKLIKYWMIISKEEKSKGIQSKEIKKLEDGIFKIIKYLVFLLN